MNRDLTVRRERIQKWIAALRSGQYGQCRNFLRNKDTFCCLGVACDVFFAETGEGVWLTQEHYGSVLPQCFIVPSEENRRVNDNLPPSYVNEWFGISSETEEYLVYLNDTVHQTFEKIAAYLEERLEEGTAEA